MGKVTPAPDGDSSCGLSYDEGPGMESLPAVTIGYETDAKLRETWAILAQMTKRILYPHPMDKGENFTVTITELEPWEYAVLISVENDFALWHGNWTWRYKKPGFMEKYRADVAHHGLRVWIVKGPLPSETYIRLHGMCIWIPAKNVTFE